MKCGSYPLHILCGQSTTIRQDVLMALLQADPSVVTRQDHNGDTPLSLLWKNVQRFRWARQSSAITLHDPNCDHTNNHNNKQMMISPNQCLQFSLDMIRANLRKPTIHLVDVCSMPRCPPQLIQLLLQYSQFLQMDLNATDHQGRTPLHQAARQPPMTLRFTLPTSIYIPSVLDYLLEALPHQACLKDRSGRIPLHYALANQQSFETLSQSTLDRLVATNPDSLITKDPITRLYPFALVALPDDHHHHHHHNDHNPHQTTINDDSDKDYRMENGDEDVRQLDTILRLLRQFPEAAIYQG
jgi:ankyrin repeat protein